MVVNVSGGIGNQMFQYAFGYAYARNNSESVCFDIFYLGLDKNRNLGLSNYNITYQCFGRIRGAVYFLGKKLLKKGIYFRKWNRANHIILEMSPYVKEEIKGQNLYAIGTWLNEDYFKKYRKELLNEFVFKGKLNLEQKRLMEKMRVDNSVAVHIRRGDYLNQENEVYRVLPKEYYLRAINFVKRKEEICDFYFFSDDIAWCKAEFKEIEHAFFIDSQISNSPYVDLELMKQCKCFIIANSTFSWWGAWLSERENKTMIAPVKWFNGEENEIYNFRVKKALLKDYILL